MVIQITQRRWLYLVIAAAVAVLIAVGTAWAQHSNVCAQYEEGSWGCWWSGCAGTGQCRPAPAYLVR